MPKRVGGGLLGNHERHALYNLYQAHPSWNQIIPMLSSLFPFLPHSTVDTILLYFFLFFMIATFYIFSCTFTNMLLKRLLRDAPPPWAIARYYIFYPHQRHHRKHGRYKSVAMYPSISYKHVCMLLSLLFTPSTSHFLTSTSRTPLHDIPWASSTTNPTFNLEHFDMTFPLDADPSDIMTMMNFTLGSTLSAHHDLTQRHAPIYFSLLDNPTCYMSESPTSPPLIVDTGASVCISPIKSDFKTYLPSTMRIKDLSSSNSVAGEGMLHWHVMDINKKQVTLVLPGFHIPTAEVRLLSPQLLLGQCGGYSHQTSSKIQIHLESGECLNAHYCARSRLPILQMSTNDTHQSFWTSTFQFTSQDAAAYPTVLSESNVNLSAAQKEVLLWHHKLSHASLG